jgi:hypothetical protein
MPEEGAVGEEKQSEIQEAVQRSGCVTTAEEFEERLCCLWGCVGVRDLPPHAVQLVACAWRIEIAKKEREQLLRKRHLLVTERRQMVQRFRNQASTSWEEIRLERWHARRAKADEAFRVFSGPFGAGHVVPTVQFMLPGAYRSNLSGAIVAPVVLLCGVEKK